MSYLRNVIFSYTYEGTYLMWVNVSINHMNKITLNLDPI